MLKKFLIGTLAVVAFVVTTNLVLASYDFGSATLKVGSRGQYVTTLQNLVGATPIDGFFGSKTKAKVVAWQAANGLAADGLFGPVSKAKANETGTNFSTGCTNASGFSTTTGLSCSSLNANTFPTGCTNASGFSITTGLACSSLSAHTFLAGCTNASGFSTTTGYSCLTGLPAVRGGGGSGWSNHHSDTIISATAIAGVTAPVTGATPVTTVTAGTGYTGTVAWSPSNNPFSGGVVYTATITLTATSGYTLTGVTADQFTIAGSTTDTNSTNSGVITAVFPATSTTIIVATAIAGVTAPVTGATPVTIVTAGTGYTGTVTWSGTPSTFASATSYTATITLTATSGYTLTGVTADQFTIAGSTSDTNPINSGVITAVFPATALADRTSPVFTTTSATTTITITLAGGTFKAAPIVAADFTFGGTNAAAIAANGIFGRTDATHVAITGLSAKLSGVTYDSNTVTVLGATQATQAASVTAVSS